jgi:hypothetical protein
MARNSMLRWSRFLLALVFGLILGLGYGWFLRPVEIVDISPPMLSSAYRADLVLMVAEIYASSSDLDSATFSLSALFLQPPSSIVADALDFATDNSYTQTDIAALQLLANAIYSRLPGVSP